MAVQVHRNPEVWKFKKPPDARDTQIHSFEAENPLDDLDSLWVVIRGRILTFAEPCFRSEIGCSVATPGPVIGEIMSASSAYNSVLLLTYQQ